MSHACSNKMEVFSSPIKWRCCLFVIADTYTCYIWAKTTKGAISECSADVQFYQYSSDIKKH